MRRRVFSCFCTVLVLAVSAAAQSPQVPERTSDGRPDLQGYWYFGLATPLERPKEFGNQVYLTPEQARAFEQRTADRRRDVVAVHGPEWLDYGSHVGDDRRTSIVIDPPDGRVPALTPQALAKETARRAVEQRGIADNPEERSPQERCLVFGAGPPLLPGPYNNNIEIVQTSDAVVVLSEMIHDARIVALDRGPAPPDSMRFWLGASRGRWEGDTLIVETTNFAPLVTFRGSDERLRVVERFTPEGKDALRYEFTIDDPTAFTGRWTGAYTMTRTADRIYEYACHEGNVGLLNILSQARTVPQK